MVRQLENFNAKKKGYIYIFKIFTFILSIIFIKPMKSVFFTHWFIKKIDIKLDKAFFGLTKHMQKGVF